MRFSVRSVSICVLVAAACGGGEKKKPAKPVAKPKPKPAAPAPETEEDRVVKRLAAAHGLVPDGSSCMPAALKPGAEGAPTLELGAVDGAPVVCAFDTDTSRLLGPLACWSLDTQSGALSYKAPQPLPGRDFAVRLDDRCARGFCLPEDVVLPTPPVVRIAWSHGADKVAVVIPGSEPEIHIFGAADKAHQGVIKPKASELADKALPTDLAGIVFVGDVVAAVGTPGDAGAAVFLYKTDGTPVGPIERLGGKTKGPVDVSHGGVSVFGDNQIAASEDAMTTLTTIEIATGKRAKLVRKPPKTSCKSKELDALLAGNPGNVTIKDKCTADFAKQYAPLIGATLVQGRKNHLALLRGDRYGELAVLDAKTLVENRHFAAGWCPDQGEAPTAEGGSDEAAPEGDKANE